MKSALILLIATGLTSCVPKNTTTSPNGVSVTQTSSSVKSSAVNVAMPYYAHYNFPNSSVENTYNAFKSVFKTSTRFGLLAEGPKVTDGFDVAWKDASLIGVIGIDFTLEQKQKDTYVLISLDSLPTYNPTVVALEKDLRELGLSVQKTLKLETSEFKLGN
jgi:hypothetical protein